MKKLYKDSSKAKSYFYYYGWTILAFFGVFFLIPFIIYQSMFYVKRNQRIDFFIAAHGMKDESVFNSLKKEFKDNGIIDVNIYSYIEDDINIYNYFSANGEDADFVVFSETNVNDLEDYLIYNYYDLTEFTTHVPSLASYQTYISDDDHLPHAIKIFDKDDDAYNNSHKFNELINFVKEGKDNESYYLLVDTNSPYFGEKSNPSIGYDILEYLLSSVL